MRLEYQLTKKELGQAAFYMNARAMKLQQLLLFFGSFLFLQWVVGRGRYLPFLCFWDVVLLFLMLTWSAFLDYRRLVVGGALLPHELTVEQGIFREAVPDYSCSEEHLPCCDGVLRTKHFLYLVRGSASGQKRYRAIPRRAFASEQELEQLIRLVQKRVEDKGTSEACQTEAFACRAGGDYHFSFHADGQMLSAVLAELSVLLQQEQKTRAFRESPYTAAAVLGVLALFPFLVTDGLQFRYVVIALVVGGAAWTSAKARRCRAVWKLREQFSKKFSQVAPTNWELRFDESGLETATPQARNFYNWKVFRCSYVTDDQILFVLRDGKTALFLPKEQLVQEELQAEAFCRFLTDCGVAVKPAACSAAKPAQAGR